MKKIFLSLATAAIVLSLSSCTTTVHLAGNHSVMSNNSIDNKKEVQVLKKTSSTDSKQIKKKENRSEYLAEAVDRAIAKDTTGNGVYLANAKVYIIHKTIPFIGWRVWFYVEGDVVGYK